MEQIHEHRFPPKLDCWMICCRIPEPRPEETLVLVVGKGHVSPRDQPDLSSLGN